MKTLPWSKCPVTIVYALLSGEEQGLYGGRLMADYAEEQGWQVLLVPEEHDGLGFGIMDMAVILEEIGRRLTPCPLLETAFATLALRAAAAANNASSTSAPCCCGHGRRATWAMPGKQRPSDRSKKSPGKNWRLMPRWIPAPSPTKKSSL